MNNSTLFCEHMFHDVLCMYRLLFLLQLFLLLCVLVASENVQPHSIPLACYDPHRVCSAYLHYTLNSTQSVSDVQTLFDVGAEDVIIEATSQYNPQSPYTESLFVKILCSCSASGQYFSHDSYNVKVNSTLTYIISQTYQGLAWSPTDGTETEMNGSTISLSLLCGCSSTDWIYLLSHVVTAKDSIQTVAARFNSNVSAIQTANNMSLDVLYTGVAYFIPINYVSGSSVAVLEAPAQSTSESNSGMPAPNVVPGDHSPNLAPKGGAGMLIGIIVGTVGGTFIIVATSIGLRLYLRSAYKSAASKNGSAGSKYDQNNEKPWFSMEFCPCIITEKPLNQTKTYASDTSTCQNTLSKDVTAVVFDIEKPIVFSHKEVIDATDNFKESNMVGKGAYGTVYFGILRDQEVAIKRMKASKTKEFIAELKVLCNVHHTNLVELIGYSSSIEELFLVYEYAENKSVSDRLHDPMNKGFVPLTWIIRVQIALDAARGLEYIHDHTKSHYVHRDVKTSNILLDKNFRAKVADFGLSKLVEQTGDGESCVTRVVGTFGYLAPEYLRDGQATSKSDVYAFGVVLFELITGQQAISRGKVFESRTPERRSLLSVMLRALTSSSPTSIDKLRDVVDPYLENVYPSDLLYKMAKLAQQCVEEDPCLRPDMKQLVFTLSHIFTSTIEWEASLAGISQEYTGLIEGR